MSPRAGSLRIRGAGEEDLPAVLSLLEQLTDAMAAPVAAVPERVADHVRRFLADADHAVFLAEQAGRIVGLISVQVRWTLLQPNPAALIDELIVSDSARGKGIGRRLVEEAVRFAKRHDCEELEVGTEKANEAAQAFYRECGFDEEHVLLEMELTAESHRETNRGQN